LKYGELVAHAARMDPPEIVALKRPEEFKLIGTSAKRLDAPAKVDGSAVYGIDARPPGVKFATLAQSPVSGGRLKSVNDAAARRIKGVRQIVRLDDAVAVVADHMGAAKKGLAALQIDWDDGPHAGLTTEDIARELEQATLGPGPVAQTIGDTDKALADAATKVKATYQLPFLAHAAMEPMNCTVHLRKDACEIWIGSQAVARVQAAAAETAGLPLEKVIIHNHLIGGGFGRRLEADGAIRAVQIARHVDGPVKVVWSREEDIQHDFYRPAAAVRFRAGLDAVGKLVALEARMVSASSPSFAPPTGPPFFTGGVSDQHYAIPNFRVTGIDKKLGVRFGFWRSVNDSHNPFMFEGFIDEVARASRQDPLAFRRALLANERPGAKRVLAVLELAAARAGWGKARPGHFLGLGCFEGFGSFIATACDITVKGREVTLHKVTTAVDCGVAVHPDNIRAQLEGGMAYGLTALLRGEITLENGAVKQSNFTDYPMLSMAEMPLFEAHIVPSTEAPGGIGEPGTGPIAPALANAIYAATGERIRTLPLSRHGYTFKVQRSRA
jgi:isoquinoline 1-oxidoreductase beta subunit